MYLVKRELDSQQTAGFLDEARKIKGLKWDFHKYFVVWKKEVESSGKSQRQCVYDRLGSLASRTISFDTRVFQMLDPNAITVDALLDFSQGEGEVAVREGFSHVLARARDLKPITRFDGVIEIMGPKIGSRTVPGTYAVSIENLMDPGYTKNCTGRDLKKVERYVSTARTVLEGIF